jgi:hypothetical protein
MTTREYEWVRQEYVLGIHFTMNLLKKGTKIKRKMENLMGNPLPSRYNDKKEEDNF